MLLSPVWFFSPPPFFVCLQVLKFQEAQNRVSASNDFFRGLSKEADLVMDGDLLMVSWRLYVVLPPPPPPPQLTICWSMDGNQTHFPVEVEIDLTLVIISPSPT